MVHYSKLCDSSPELYRAYLATSAVVGFFEGRRFDGGSGIDGLGGVVSATAGSGGVITGNDGHRVAARTCSVGGGDCGQLGEGGACVCDKAVGAVVAAVRGEGGDFAFTRFVRDTILAECQSEVASDNRRAVPGSCGDVLRGDTDGTRAGDSSAEVVTSVATSACVDGADDGGIGKGEQHHGASGAIAESGAQFGVPGFGVNRRRNLKKREKAKREKAERLKKPWRTGYCETVTSGSGVFSEQSRETPPTSVGVSPVSSQPGSTLTALSEAEQAARESLARRRVVENELAIVKTKAQIASYADVEKSKAIAELKIARIAQWNNEARMKSQKSWADYKRSLENSPAPSFKASDLPSAASAGEYWWKQQCLKSKEMEEQIKHLEAIIKASMPYVSPEGLEKMREVPDPEPVIDPEFEALKRAHRELAAAEGLDGYDSGDDIGYDLFMPPGNL